MLGIASFLQGYSKAYTRLSSTGQNLRKPRIYLPCDRLKMLEIVKFLTQALDTLTHNGTLLDNRRAVGTLLAVGFSSSLSKGVQSPLKTVVFLCQKISAYLKTHEPFYYGVVILGELNGSPHLCAALLTLLNHATQCLAALGGGYSLSSKGFTA